MAVNTQELEPALVDLARRIGFHVRSLRRANGLSRRTLSENSGVSERYLAKLEAGDGNVSVGILYRLSLVFGCAVEALVAGGKFSKSEKSHRIALVGVRGGGKTTLGRAISSALGLDFIEISKQITAVSGMAVREMISLYGQEGFRRYEKDAIASIIKSQDKVIIAVGSGIVETPENYEFLLRHFHTVWIKASPAEHIERVQNQGDDRPMRGFDAAEEHLRNMLDRRELEFSRMDFELSTEGAGLSQSILDLTAIIDDNTLLQG